MTALSARQRDCLGLIVQGKTNKEIARELGISTASVKTHMGTLFLRLGVHTRTEAAVKAVMMKGEEYVALLRSQPAQV